MCNFQAVMFNYFAVTFNFARQLLRAHYLCLGSHEEVFTGGKRLHSVPLTWSDTSTSGPSSTSTTQELSVSWFPGVDGSSSSHTPNFLLASFTLNAPPSKDTTRNTLHTGFNTVRSVMHTTQCACFKMCDLYCTHAVRTC